MFVCLWCSAFILYSHSKPFHAALLFSLIEYVVENMIWPQCKRFGLVNYIEAMVQKTPELRPVIAEGLAALDTIAADRGAADFATLEESQRPEVLEGLAAAHPGFLPSLIFHTFTGYYQNPSVNAALGIETQPPFPRGFSLDQGDLSLLDAVKQKPKMYREV